MKIGNSPCFNCSNPYLNCYETCPYSPKREQNTIKNKYTEEKVMSRYFKIVEIDADEFINATGEDLDCCQL